MIERHLHYFTIVAEEEHFQRAANRLSITQSALSRRIQQLEHELGFELFERTGRGVKLTPAGDAFYRRTRVIMQDLDRAVDHARRIRHGNCGTVVMGINPSAASSSLAIRFLQNFRRDHPDIDLQLRSMYSEEQLPAILSEAVDFGLVYLFSKSDQLEYTHVSTDELVLMIDASHELASKPRLELADISELEFIWPRRSQSPIISDWLIAAFANANLSPRICMEVDNAESVANLIAVGIGAGFAMRFQIGHLPDNVVVREVEGLSLKCELALARRLGVDMPVWPHIISSLEDARRG